MKREPMLSLEFPPTPTKLDVERGFVYWKPRPMGQVGNLPVTPFMTAAAVGSAPTVVKPRWRPGGVTLAIIGLIFLLTLGMSIFVVARLG